MMNLSNYVTSMGMMQVYLRGFKKPSSVQKATQCQFLGGCISPYSQKQDLIYFLKMLL